MCPMVMSRHVFMFAALGSLQVGDKPAIPTRQMGHHILHAPLTVHAGLLHALRANLMEECYPDLTFTSKRSGWAER
jgi:hypothetical protein